MNNSTLFEAYCKYCELANTAADKGQSMSAATYYRKALDYSDKLLESEIDDNLRQQLIIRSKEIVNAILAFESDDAGVSIKTQKDKSPKRKGSWFSTEVPKYKLSDVKGLKDVIEQIESDIITPIRYPQVYSKYADEFGSRILLYGPPGTGKTFVVKCLAGELGCKIALARGQDILDKYVGEGESKIKEIFEEANQYDKSLIFFDEIDALAADRDSDDSRNTKGILTALLTEMDGFSSKKEKNKLKIIIAATNKPWALDAAIRRGGRFDAPIYVRLPDDEARYHMIENAFRLSNGSYPPIEGDPCVLFRQISAALDKWYGGGDIVAICTRIRKAVSNRAAKQYAENPNIPLPRITYNDCLQIINATPPTINQEMIDEFEKFSKGLR